VLIRYLWQLKTAVFLHRCQICTVPLRFFQNELTIDLAYVDLVVDHVGINVDDNAKPLADKLEASTSASLQPNEDVQVCVAQSGKCRFLSKIVSYSLWTDSSDISLLFELDLELMKLVHSR